MKIFEILPTKLYISGVLGERFHNPLLEEATIINCIHDADIAIALSPLYIRVPFDDRPMNFDGQDKRLMNQLRSVAYLAVDQIMDKEVVIAHCTNGINQSAFIAGMILAQMKRNKLVTMASVVDFIRNKRPGALTNQTFVDKLAMLDS